MCGCAPNPVLPTGVDRTFRNPLLEAARSANAGGPSPQDIQFSSYEARLAMTRATPRAPWWSPARAAGDVAGSDWNAAAIGSVRYGYTFPGGDTTRCASDGRSVVRASLVGLRDALAQIPNPIDPDGRPIAAASLPTDANPVLDEAYLAALWAVTNAGVERAANAPAMADIVADLARRSGPLSPGTIKALVWVAYFNQGNAGRVGVGSPANVVLPEGTTGPTFGVAPPLPSNGRFNDSTCDVGGGEGAVATVRGWASNPLVLLGAVVVGAVVIGELNRRSPRIRQIKGRRRNRGR